jgi:predicted ATPase
MEAGYRERTGERAAELALHFVRGRDEQRAAAYLWQAAANALGKSAYQEVIGHLTKGLEVPQRRPGPAREQGFRQPLAAATILRGWAVAAQGQVAEGLPEMHQGLAGFRATGAEDDRPYWLALLAEMYGRGGQVEAGLQALTQALTFVQSQGVRVWEAELHRLRGELVLQSGGPSWRAESSFHQALTVARQQSAKSLELRASMSLSQLWQRQGKQDEARQLLAGIYDWFTERFETADLKAARVMMEELA